MLLGASLKEIIHFPSCNLLIWWITIDFLLLNHTCISGVNINPFSCSWPELSYMTIYNEKETLHVLRKKGRWVWWIATSLCNTSHVNSGPTRTAGATGWGSWKKGQITSLLLHYIPNSREPRGSSNLEWLGLSWTFFPHKNEVILGLTSQDSVIISRMQTVYTFYSSMNWLGIYHYLDVLLLLVL